VSAATQKFNYFLEKGSRASHPADIRFPHCVPNPETSAAPSNDHFPLNGNGSAAIKLTNAPILMIYFKCPAKEERGKLPGGSNSF